MTDRSLQALEFQLDLLRLSGLAREQAHKEAKTIAELSSSYSKLEKRVEVLARTRK